MNSHRCSFTFRGRPATKPGTEADQKRIELSQWLTRLIGDGATYQTPGASGYTPEELASAEQHYAPAVLPEPTPLPVRSPHPTPTPPVALVSNPIAQAPYLPPAPSPPQATQREQQQFARQKQALKMLRAGKPCGQVIREIHGLSNDVLATWRKDPDFARQWDEAKGKGRMVRLARREKQPAQVPVATGPVCFLALGLEKPVCVIAASLGEALEEGQRLAQTTKQAVLVLRAVAEFVPVGNSLTVHDL